MKLKEYINSELNEMSAADAKGIDASKGIEEYTKKYIERFKERTGKAFTGTAIPGLRTAVKKVAEFSDEDAVKAGAIAKEYANIPEAKTHAERSKTAALKRKDANDEENAKMKEAVRKAAKKARDAYDAK